MSFLYYFIKTQPLEMLKTLSFPLKILKIFKKIMVMLKFLHPRRFLAKCSGKYVQSETWNGLIWNVFLGKYENVLIK